MKGRVQLVFGGGEVFVATDAFDGEEVGVGAGVAGGAVAVVDVEEEVVFGGFLNGVGNPGGFFLRADVDEADFDAFDAEFFVEGEEEVALGFELAAIDVEEEADVFGLGVVGLPGG